MQLGIGSYTFGWAVQERVLSARDIIARAAEWKIGVAQLCNNLPAETFEAPLLAALCDMAAEKQVAVEIGTQGSDPAHLRKMIGVARTAGSPILRVVLDLPDDKPSPAEAVKRLKAVLPALAEARVILAIENHDRFPAAVLAKIIDDLGTEHVGICLDTVNSIGAAEGPRQVVAALAPHVVNLHLKDFAVERVPSLQGFVVEGRPTGEGMLDVPWLIAELAKYGRTKSAIIELWTPPEASIQQTIDKEFDWAERSVANARQWFKDQSEGMPC